MSISNYENLIVFKKAHEIVLAVYQLIQKFPEDQKYLLSKQLFRSISSVPANIAEGFGRSSNKDKRRFIIISRGSAEESKYHLLLAKDLNFINTSEYEILVSEITEVIKILNKFEQKFNKI
ncbi:MAG TPA: four helix bundle protein [Candidatus Dojkabacteria bacterium]|nr:four helix bundle protein [Candidatus Dojkabacteria bacterium]HQF37218.1 four helix bundle protein [Candidatus Dojkabacteria bacterium]